MNGISWDMVFLLQFVLAINRLGVMLKALILPATALHEMRWEKRLAKVLSLNLLFAQKHLKYYKSKTKQNYG